jgi:glycosyltransferase involved in cell wall biosynthesis
VKVAFYSPLPPERTGIADYSALLLPKLAERIGVVVAARERRRRFRFHDSGADIALYHVGNNPDYHGWIVDALRRRPGVVVLHDFVLHHLVAGITLARGDAVGYLNAMEREAGVVGRSFARAVLDARIPPLWETDPTVFPLAGVVLDLATGLIVHSRHVEERARAAGYEGPIRRIPMPAWPVPELEPAPIEGGPVFGAFGHLNESKRAPQLLDAFARVRRRRPDARLLLVGDTPERGPRLNAGEGVIREPYVPEERLWSLMAACNACVSLRYPTMGETSAIAVRALSLGKPLVVSDVGWFSELPDEVAIKVPVGEGEIEALEAALEQAAASPAMGAAGRFLAETEHALDRVADLYAAALEESAGGDAVREAVLQEVALAAAEVGLGTGDAAALAAGLRGVGLGDE